MERELTLEEINECYGSDYRDENPSVYCGTYYKYNCGSIFGAWLDLTKFADYEEFMYVCRQLHADESDPEFMFQDYENFPRCLYNEGGMGEKTFDQIIEFSELSEDEKGAFEAYLGNGHNYDLKEFRESYQGEYESESDFAEYIAHELYNIESMGVLGYYIDYKSYGEELFSTDYTFINGYVFRG